MEFSGQILWGIIGAVVGAGLASIILLVAPRLKKKKPAPEVKEKEVIKEEVLPAAFEIANLLVTPSQVKEGEPVTVLAQVSNIGGSPGKHDVTLMVDRRVIDTKGVTLEPSSTTMVDFTLKETRAGEHIVEVNGVIGRFFIPPPKFVLSNLTITPERVKEREGTTVAVKVTNDGGSTGSYLAELKVRGMTEMAQEITLPPDASQILSFSIAKKNAGFYPIEIGSLSGRLIVEMADFFERI